MLIVIALLKATVSKFLKEMLKLDSGLVIVKILAMLMLTLAMYHRSGLLLKKYHRHKPKFGFFYYKIFV